MTGHGSVRSCQGGPFGPPWLTLGFAAGLLLLYWLFGPAPEVLLYDREEILGGAWWRVFTGQLVHADAGHLFWNVAALLGLGLVYEYLCRPSPLAYCALLLTGLLAVGLWLLWIEPHWARYCGFSGVLNAYYSLVALRLWRETRSPVALLLILGGLAKIGAESWLGGALLPTSTWQSVPGAHLAGFLAGLALASRLGRSGRSEGAISVR